MISRRMGDNSGSALRIAQLQNRVDCAAKLECANLLKILTLEGERAATSRIERAARHHGGTVHPRSDTLGCQTNLVGTDQNGGGFWGTVIHDRSRTRPSR